MKPRLVRLWSSARYENEKGASHQTAYRRRYRLDDESAEKRVPAVERYRYRIYHTCVKDRIRLPGNRLSFEQGLRAVMILARAFLKIPTRDVVLLWGNSRFICTLRIPIMKFAVMARKPFIVKVFGAYLAERLRNLTQPVRAVVTGLLCRDRFVLPQTGHLESELVNGTGGVV